MMPDDPDDILGDIAERARDAADADPRLDSAPDLVAELENRTRADAGKPPDLTLGGYRETHGRPAAFKGIDEQPYSVAIDVERVREGRSRSGAEASLDSEAPSDDSARPAAGDEFAAFFVFVRWAGSGAAIMGHVESGDVAYGATEEEARDAALELSLYEAKAELDAAIRRQHADEWSADRRTAGGDAA